MAKKSVLEYSFRVNLKGNKRVWRKVVLTGDHTLHNLHKMIFRAFDRYEEHLYSFYFPKEPTGKKLKVKEYSSPFHVQETNPLFEEQRFNADKTMLDSLNLKVGQTFEYLFDFGDNWLHEIKVIEIEPASRTRRRSLVTERHGESPPQYPDYDEEDEDEEDESEKET